jgi:hypothetical protein
MYLKIRYQIEIITFLMEVVKVLASIRVKDTFDMDDLS